MPQFYVPTFPEQAAAAHGLMPHVGSQIRRPHCNSEKEAQGFLNGHNPALAYYGVENTDKPMTFGPNGQSRLEWPRIEAIYRVEVLEEDKLREMKDWERTYPGIGTFGRLRLDPSTILSRTTTIYPDALHEKPWVASDEPHLGEHIKDQHIAEQMMQRGADLQRMYHILERSGEKERESLNLENPEHLDIMKKLCVYKDKDLSGSLEDRTMTLVLRQIGEQVGVRTALEISAGRIEAEFAEQLNNTDPDTPAAERVAVAMSGTLNKFAAQVPQRDAVALTKISAQIKGVVHDMAQEIGLQEQARDAQNSQFVNDLPDELRPAWAKVPEEEKDDFVEEFRRQRERAELDAAADKAVFMATVFALQRAANMASNMALVTAYDGVLEAMDDELLPDDKEFFTDEPDEIGDI